VSVSGVSKRYGATQALRGVDLDIGPGEVLGLIGANGAGKSTLIKILSGATRPTAGEIRLGGRPAGFASPLDAQDAGIQTVHQNIDDGVVFGTTVAENLTLDTLAPHRSGNSFWASRKRTVTAARDLAAAAHLDVPLDVPVETLSASARQHLIIARVLARRPKLLILDEPTSALSAAEADELVVTVRRLADTGVSVLYVSHRLNEIQALCDRAAVLRDGGIQRVFGAPFEGHRLVEAMLGEQVEQLQHEARAGGAAVLEAEGVRAWPSAAPFSLIARTDEVVGMTGLIGSGKTEFLEQLYGARPLVSGSLRLRGEPYRPRDPRAAVAAGVGLVPEERGVQALLPGWSVRAHVSLPRLRGYSHGGLLSRRDESSAAERVIDAFGVRCDGPAAAIETLSGGNQQKVVVGRWLGGASRGAPGGRPPGLAARLVLLDEPFRGVDVGARAEIARKLRDHAGEVGVIVASSDPQEVTQVADRVLVMRDGTLAGELPAGEATAERIAALMAGSAR
jgi:simple sugar transport system ATP-binding protein